MDNCIFCKIANGEIPTNFLYEDDLVVAIDDIKPVAPIHSLVIPKKHYDNIIDHVPGETLAAMAHAVEVVTEQKNIQERGFRIIMNIGKDGAQSQNHLHWHILGGIRMTPSIMGKTIPADQVED